MTAEIPHAVLSEHFQERMGGRRLVAAVFVTFQFDAAFFEQEVLPAFLDVPLSHAAVIRLVQLEEALKTLHGEIAVYYDTNGLVRGSDGSAKLDIQRLPVRCGTGIFHAKNVFLLVEDTAQDNDGKHPQALLVASLSANLTRSGWWENVEACHVEEIPDGDKTVLKDDLESFLESLRTRAADGIDHLAIGHILRFLRRTEPRLQKSADGQLHTHFYRGMQSLPDFFDEIAGPLLRGSYLEILSPYVDDDDECLPLQHLIDRFQPKEVRVLLPLGPEGQVACRETLYKFVREVPDCSWGNLPRKLLLLGNAEAAGLRRVHAKVYRFFTQAPKREVCFIGSANLTRAAHQRGGNVESGFLVDFVPARRPEFWLCVSTGHPKNFPEHAEDEAPVATGGTPLNLVYHWNEGRASAFWAATTGSPPLTLRARGIEVGRLSPLPSREWVDLTPEIARRLEEILRETSVFEVVGVGSDSAMLLVQEEGMSHKPSILFELSVSDILRYWALLTTEQRLAFLEARLPLERALAGQGSELLTRANALATTDTLFDRFAGIFHAFGCLERAVRDALEQGRAKDVAYRLFGKKYDSLGSLLDRVASQDEESKLVEAYVIVLCAKQMWKELLRDYPDQLSPNSEDARQLKQRFDALGVVRDQLLHTGDSSFSEFLGWFDFWFMRRATVTVEGTP
jgi:hypothetical protein